MSRELDQIVQIKAMMEKSTRFLSLSGLSGVAAGIIALIGAWVADYILENESYSSKVGRAVVGVKYSDPVVYKLILLAIIVLITAVGAGLFFTLRKVKKEKVKAWNPTSRRMVFHLFFPLAAGGGFILLLLKYNAVSLVAPCLLIFYGLSLLNASKFTHDDIKQLGIIEVILGLVCGLFPHQGLLFWIIGFGILHILYGIIMYWEIRKKVSLKGLITQLNKAFENRVRLGIMSALMVNDSLDFNGLKELLEVSDGNLASHLTHLEKKEYISVNKRFINKKPNTSYAVSKEGRAAFELHVKALEQLLGK